MKKRQTAPDPTAAYARAVVAGKILTGRLVRLACERHLRDLTEGKRIEEERWRLREAIQRQAIILEELSTPLIPITNEILVMPDIKKKLVELGIVAVPTSVAAFNTFLKDQVAVLGPTVKGAGIKL